MASNHDRTRAIYNAFTTLKNITLSCTSEYKFICENPSLAAIDDDDDDTSLSGENITITGRLLPHSKIYKDGSVRIDIILGPAFPRKPPEVIFKTKVYHPNITAKGQVCLHLLEAGGWNPNTTLRTVIEEVTKLLDQPSTDGIQYTEAAALWSADRPAYEEKASEIYRQNSLPRE